MTKQELQYLIQIMANADIKGNASIFHATLMSKLNQMLQEEAPPNNQETDDGSSNL